MLQNLAVKFGRFNCSALTPDGRLFCAPSNAVGSSSVDCSCNPCTQEVLMVAPLNKSRFGFHSSVSRSVQRPIRRSRHTATQRCIQLQPCETVTLVAMARSCGGIKRAQAGAVGVAGRCSVQGAAFHKPPRARTHTPQTRAHTHTQHTRAHTRLNTAQLTNFNDCVRHCNMGWPSLAIDHTAAQNRVMEWASFIEGIHSVHSLMST